MERRSFALGFLASVVILLALSHYQDLALSSKAFVRDDKKTLADIQKIFPQAAFYKDTLKKDAWVSVFDARKEPIGKVVFTKPFVEEEGYAGAVHLCIGASPDGRIVGVALSENKETPDVIEFLTEKKFFESWNGLDAKQSLNKKVDAITGATITTEAIINAFQKRLALIQKDAAFPKPNTPFSWKNILAFAALAFSLFVFFRPRTSRTLHLILLLSNVIVLGFLTFTMLSLSLFEKWITQGGSWTDIRFWIFAGTAAMALWLNRNFYCSHVCPFGSLQELAGSYKNKKIVIHPRLAHVLHWIKLCYFLIIVGLVAGGIGVHLHFFEPFFTFTLASVPLITLLIFVLFLAASFFLPRSWCQFVCPTGAVIRSFLKKDGPVNKKAVILVVLFLLGLSAFVFFKARPVLKICPVVTPAEAAGEHPALFFKSLVNRMVGCELCPHQCVIKEGGVGFCRARKNIGGKLYALTYGAPVALHVDPIEKKPFAHVFPGSRSFSLATAGCNLRCKFCQNWEISQLDAEKVEVSYVAPEEIVSQAKESGAKTIAFTYTEPVIFYEYMLDIAKAAQKEGLACVMHSAGFVNEAPLRALCKYLLAANIDLKGFDEKFYTGFTNGHLETVLRTLKVLKEEGVWVEITNLLIPGANDSDEMITGLCTWVKDNLGAQTPIHFSRFYPMYKLVDLSPTPVETLKRAYAIAKKVGLEFVYIGNVPDTQGEDTVCPMCGKTLIKRKGYFILENNIVNGKCPSCGYSVPGIW